MKYNVLSYLIGEGFKNVLKNKKSTGASLMIMCATMIIFGVFFMIGENINHIMNELEMQQGMQVFIIDEATEKQVSELGEKIRALNGVNQVEFVSKEDALNQMKEKVGDKQFLLSGYEENNPFPASYVVTLTDLKESSNVQNEINKFENVKSIQSRGDTINGFTKYCKFSKNNFWGYINITSNNINIYYCKYNKINCSCKKKRNFYNEICRSNK